MRLEGRVALVTGGASGIGAATARRLAAEGARVAIGDLNLEGARDVAGEIDGFATALDVTQVASTTAAAAAVSEALGPVEILVNNAGTDRLMFFHESDEAQWDFVLGVNLKGTLAMTHAVLGAMHRLGRGSIVNVASEAGRTGSAALVTYSAAKAGVIGFTKALARESARHGIRVNAVAPGPISTPLLEDNIEATGELGVRLRETMIQSTVLRRIGQPEEVAAAIAYLASDDASYVTGQTLGVSGGLSMW